MAFPIENLLSPNLTNMLITFVIPFLIFFAILLFVLKRTKIFGEGSFIYVLISLGLTVMIYAINPGNVFQFLASYLFQIGVAGSIIAFVGVIILLFFGVIRWGAKTAESLGKTDPQKLQDLEKNERKLMEKYYSRGLLGGPNVAQRMKIQEEIDRLEKDKRFLLAKMRRMS